MSSKLKNTLIQGELFVSPAGSTTDSGIKIRYAGGRGFIESSSGTTRGSITLGSYNNSYGVECFLNFSKTKTLGLVPASTNSSDIGSEDYRYRNIYTKNIKAYGDAYVYGDLHATAAYEISDIRLKENIKPLEDRGNLSPVSFKFKDKEGQHLGFIAQELQEKYPEIVTENNDGYLSVNYPEITAILAAQVNDLKKEIADLKQEIQNLKK